VPQLLLSQKGPKPKKVGGARKGVCAAKGLAFYKDVCSVKSHGQGVSFSAKAQAGGGLERVCVLQTVQP